MGKYMKNNSMRNISTSASFIGKYRKCSSSVQLQQVKSIKQRKIRENFKIMFRRLMANTTKNNQKCMLSFLNVMVSCEDIIQTSIMAGIPSIQNMLSHHFINHGQEDEIIQRGSMCSITQPIQTSLLNSQPQIPIYFMCLLDKIKKMISCPLSKTQNQYIIKGTWNILIKYWRDTNYTIFKLNQNIEWGLLQLLNFNFFTGKKQRFQAQQRLRNTLQNIQCSIHSLQYQEISLIPQQNSLLNQDNSFEEIQSRLESRNHKFIDENESQNLIIHCLRKIDVNINGQKNFQIIRNKLDMISSGQIFQKQADNIGKSLYGVTSLNNLQQKSRSK